LSIYFQINLAAISYNVPGCIWRFCGCDKETRSVSATAKMCWSEPWERA